MTAILQLVDSLDVGGTEKVAVEIANELSAEGFESHLISSRQDGPLLLDIADVVQHTCLERRHRLSPGAVLRLKRYIRKHRVDLIHAHSSSLFLAAATKLLAPETRLVWHDHFGAADIESRPEHLYRMALGRADAVIAVNRDLLTWTRKLGTPLDRSHFLPNWTRIQDVSAGEVDRVSNDLPGHRGNRIACVANLRPQKGHGHLLRTFRMVRNERPDAVLLLVGAGKGTDYGKSLQVQAEELDVSEQTFFLGTRSDVPTVLAASTVAVLSSLSEGLPLALLEYGAARLGVVATRVGDCAEVLGDGSAGLLVPAGDEPALARSLIELMGDVDGRNRLGERLHDRICSRYSRDPAIRQLTNIYSSLLGHQTKAAA